MADTPQPEKQIPKPFLKRWLPRLAKVMAGLFLLMALVTWEENWRGERAWQLYKAERAEAGDPVRGMDFFPPNVPDAQNFALAAPLAPWARQTLNPETLQLELTDPQAARDQMDRFPTMYLQYVFHGGGPVRNRLSRIQDVASNMYLRGDRAVPNPTKDPNVGWDSSRDAAEALLNWYRSFIVMDELIEELKQRPHGRFVQRYDGLSGPNLSHHLMMVNLGSALYFRSICHMHTGNTQAALADLKTMLRICHVLNEDHISNSHLTSIMVFEFAAAALWEGLIVMKFSDDELKTIEREYTSFDWLALLKHAIQGDRELANALFDRILNDPYNSLRDHLLKSGPFWHRIRLLAPRGWIQINQLKVNQLYDEFVFPNFEHQKKRVHPALTEENHKKISALLTSKRTPYLFYTFFISKMGSPFDESHVNQTARTAATVKIIKVSCALERYKIRNQNYPSTLRGLVPNYLPEVPINITDNQPLEYERFPEGHYRIWSMGWGKANNNQSMYLKKSRDDWSWTLK